jgi:hypothetical protein
MLPPVNAEYFFWDGRIASESIAENFRLKLRAAFKEAKVKMTAHGFRHFFITQTLATGVSVEDVSHMVGTSPNEIRKTYRHFVKEATDRLDDVQVQSWIQTGSGRRWEPSEHSEKGCRPVTATPMFRKCGPHIACLLLHSEAETTSPFHVKWVQARQDRLDELVVGSWNK